MMKKSIVLLLAMVLMLSVLLVACDNSEPASTGESVDTEVAVESDDTDQTESVDLSEVNLEEPILLTSVGQSADVEMVKSMMENIGLDFESNNLAKPEDLGEAKTLVLAIGGSSKGLGAAGIDANQELDRIKELINAAKDGGLKIVATHIGGEARRGELSDKFIEPSFEKADVAIIVKSGNMDNMMTDLASSINLPIEVVDSITDVTTTLENLFK